MEKLTNRTKELLVILNSHSNRTRYIWIVLNVFSVLLFTAILNEKMSANKSRIEVRHWNTNMDALKYIEENKKDPMQDSLNTNYGIITSGLMRKDEAELEILRALQLNNFEIMKLPIFGISFSIADTSFIAALSLLIIYIWYMLGVAKERSVLALLIYPLKAKKEHEEAQLMWGEKDEEGNYDKEKLEIKINLLKSEILDIRETISSRFLSLYASADKRFKEFLVTIFLTLLPIIILSFSIGFDWYWDFGKKFKESEGVTSYHVEIEGYGNYLDSLAQIQGIPTKLKERLESSSSEMKIYANQLWWKRAISTFLVVIIILFGVSIIYTAKSMTEILTGMYEDIDKVNLRKYIDV